MSSDWPVVALDDITVSINTGLDAIRRAPIVDHETDIKCLRIQDISQGKPITKWGYTETKETDYEKYRLVKDDIIMARTCSTGINYLVKEDLPAVFNNGLARIRLNLEKAFPPFIYYVFQSQPFVSYISGISGGTSVQLNMKVGDLAKYEFKLPPIVIQKVIAEQLGMIDKKIELNRQTNQTLEHIAQAIFKSWFVDFEPTRAKIAAKKRWKALNETTETSSPTCFADEFHSADQQNDWRNISLEDAMTQAAMAAISGKSTDELEQLSPDQLQQLKETAALFPDALVESELGEIPAGWEITELGELLDFNPTRTLKKGMLAPYLDMKNVPTQGHLADEVYLREMASGTKFINGDTLLARITPCLENGKTAFVDFLKEGQVAWGSTEYIVMRPKNGRPMSLGYIIARLDAFRSKAIQTMTGTSGRQRANAKALSEQKWIDYPKPLLGVFDSIAGAYLAKARQNGDQNKTLAEIRDALLPKLLSGELSFQTNSQEVA